MSQTLRMSPIGIQNAPRASPNANSAPSSMSNSKENVTDSENRFETLRPPLNHLKYEMPGSFKGPAGLGSQSNRLHLAASTVKPVLRDLSRSHNSQTLVRSVDEVKISRQSDVSILEIPLREDEAIDSLRIVKEESKIFEAPFSVPGEIPRNLTGQVTPSYQLGEPIVPFVTVHIEPMGEPLASNGTPLDLSSVERRAVAACGPLYDIPEYFGPGANDEATLMAILMQEMGITTEDDYFAKRKEKDESTTNFGYRLRSLIRGLFPTSDMRTDDLYRKYPWAKYVHIDDTDDGEQHLQANNDPQNSEEYWMDSTRERHAGRHESSDGVEMHQFRSKSSSDPAQASHLLRSNTVNLVKRTYSSGHSSLYPQPSGFPAGLYQIKNRQF
ncbi:hypothetical protein BABINDRAFT_167969 [Babjeviella inositovora NRRL Y-12698]|uniref:Uncharacterized protein n=1 Tax=Babjeviella inositovora NRRL Y-12698 TaxID=984486 RepID=A0A1E3QMU1_9ASCO|nr:uncharacterized protein BABINDRAFT_167969 [Babjeviella inositovora NRRL Y-12698]ODQ78784.1 hypothetical protein BABINDRAFT_167969 [Babjeviella inositovora NRRL Y-12698]